MTAVIRPNKNQRREREVAVNLSTRLALPLRELLDEVSSRENISIREAIELAIVEKWQVPRNA